MSATPAPSSTELLPGSVGARRRRHLARHEVAVGHFRTAVKETFLAETDRMAREFADGALTQAAAPVVTVVREYVSWFRWCAWCSTRLAPPLGIDRPPDARRLAAALIAYCGPRLIDDALDDHRTYKGKRDTALSRLTAAFPDLPPAAVRCQVSLIGAWVLLYGIRRLERHGHPGAARRTRRIFERIMPGAVVEGLHAGPLSWDVYRQIVHRKAVLYDRILYRNLIDPVERRLRREILSATDRMSRLAQYLNDLGDRADDVTRGRRNVFEWVPSNREFWALCRTEAARIVESLNRMPEDVGDALAAALIDTFDSAARLRAESGE